MDWKNRLIIVALVAGMLLIPACTDSNRADEGGSGKIRIVTTLFPLYDMARHIGADRTDVSLLLPPGVEAHSFEPKPSDIMKINRADVFVFTSKAMEPWAADLVKSIDNKRIMVVDAGRGTRMIPGQIRDAGKPAGSPDPHIWLDFDNAVIMAGNIEKAMEAKDPADKDFFRKNAVTYRQEFTSLDAAYRSVLSRCTGREIVYGGHYAFGYLASRYGLEYLAAQGISPDAEPTAKDLARLVTQIRKDHIGYVFYEELASPRIAETIAGETRAKLLLLNAGHNVTRDQMEQGITLIRIMKDNLAALKTGLGCR
jgi:zinc transport system substrate-binding protein